MTFRKKVTIILSYVDDIDITGPRISEIPRIKTEIVAHFEIEDNGLVNYLLGMRIIRSGNTFHIDQD